MSHTTSLQFDEVMNHCRQLFINKMKDYGPAWRILRLPSLTDQIFIKAQRIRSIENKGTQLVDDDLRGEFIGIFNYSIIALIQLQEGVVERPDMETDRAIDLFDHFAKTAKELMERKNHDYGEAWREMRISSITDLILQKLLRIKQIEDNSGKTIVSEGLDANYLDMVNYAAFVLIKMSEN
tara:strand:- start:447 stop:989 length:543 start_codon:yes stop_codon:yes gene_type:complete